jgi:hypothetical protein
VYFSALSTHGLLLRIASPRVWFWSGWFSGFWLLASGLSSTACGLFITMVMPSDQIRHVTCYGDIHPSLFFCPVPVLCGHSSASRSIRSSLGTVRRHGRHSSSTDTESLGNSCTLIPGVRLGNLMLPHAQHLVPPTPQSVFFSFIPLDICYLGRVGFGSSSSPLSFGIQFSRWPGKVGSGI